MNLKCKDDNFNQESARFVVEVTVFEAWLVDSEGRWVRTEYSDNEVVDGPFYKQAVCQCGSEAEVTA